MRVVQRLVIILKTSCGFEQGFNRHTGEVSINII